MTEKGITLTAWISAGILATTTVQAATPAGADYPTRPIRMLLGVPPGGGTDVLARIVSSDFLKHMGHPVIIDNRPGAGHAIASEIVAKAPPNGYTLLMANANHTLNPFVYDKLPYDTFRDFTFVTQVVTQPLVLVVNSTAPVNSIKELIALAKAKPGSLSGGIAGTAGAGALTMQVFRRQTGTDFVIIPYKGGAQAIMGVMQGEVHFFFSSMTTGMAMIKQGKLKVIGTSSVKRLEMMPDVPTFREAGLTGLDFSPWEGILAPAGLPRAVSDKIHREVVRMLKQPEVLANLAAGGSYPVGSSPDEFTAEIRTQLESFGKAFRDMKATP
jgi:tripartite-type tricarboxylate transporter receptor subunit TctC